LLISFNELVTLIAPYSKTWTKVRPGLTLFAITFICQKMIKTAIYLI
jgi:hypothetical protein